MARIVVGEFVSLDGVMEGPGPDDSFAQAGWTMPYWDDAIGQSIAEAATASAGMLLGRVTYQGFAAAFGGLPAGHPEGDFMNKTRKYVVSRTLPRADWQNSTLIEGDALAGIAKLKDELDGDLVISGSCSLVHQLAQADMIDEYQLLVYPVVVGQGKRLFPNGLRQDLELVESKRFDSGVVRLTLRPKRGA